MTNRDMFEYLKVCNGINEDLDHEEYVPFLESEVSVKDLYLTLKDYKVDSWTIFKIITQIFDKFIGNEGKALELVECSSINYGRYFEDSSLTDYLYRIDDILNYKDTNIKNLKHRLKLCYISWNVTFKRLGRFEVKKYMNADGSSYFNLKSNQGNGYDINRIGALTFKNGDCIPYKLENKKDRYKINKIVKGLDYDLCICIDLEKISRKLDKMIGLNGC